MRFRNVPRKFVWLSLVVLVLVPSGFTFRRVVSIGVQRDGSILVPNGQQLTPAGTHVEVNDRPLGMVLSPDRRLLAVVTGSNSPNAITVSPDGRTLFVANAAQNAIAVVDANSRRDGAVRGLIPTGWYPTAVALNGTGDGLFIASGYGFGSIAPTPPGQGRSYEDRVGVVSALRVPDDNELRLFTKQVQANNESLPPDIDRSARNDDDDRGHDGDDDHSGPGGGRRDDRNPIPTKPGERSPIKHVFYIRHVGRPYVEPRDLAFGQGIRHAVQLRASGSRDAAGHRVAAPRRLLRLAHRGTSSEARACPDAGATWCRSTLRMCRADFSRRCLSMS